MTITELSIKRSTFVVIIFSAMLLLGGFCYTMLNYELIPKIDMPVMTVITTYPGASAGEVESSVTKKIEDALSSLENVKYMSSSSQENVSVIVVELQAGTNTDFSLQDAQRKVNAIQSTLPDDAGTPSLMTYSTDDIPVLKLGVSAKMDARKLYDITEDVIKAQLSKIEGVGNVMIIGGEQREIKINIDRSKLEGYHISIAQVYALVGKSNMQFATGKVEGEKNQYTVRLAGKVTSMEQLKSLVVSNTATGVVRLGDIAEIVDGTAEYTKLSRINGESSIGMMIQKTSDANSVKVCELAKKEMKKLEEQYKSDDLKFTIASDNSVFTLASADAVMEDLGLGIILVAVVMFLFLHSYRNSLIVMVSIPTSLISVFTGMYLFNFSLNMMTLMGLSLVIGILVDDSIVVLENITRHLDMGKDKRQAALDGRSEIGFTALAITFVDVVVFVPMALVTGMIGNFLREFSLVVVFSTLMSLFVSFTVTPLLASRFGKIEKLSKNSIMGKIGLGFEGYYHRLVAFYERVLRWSLGHRKVVYALASVLIVSSLFLVGMQFIGTEFMPNSDRGELTVKLEGDPQNTIFQTNQLTEQVEKIIRSKPEVEKVFTNIGYSASSGFSSAGEPHKAEINVTIVDKKERTMSAEKFAADLKREILAKVPGVKVSATPTSMFGQATAPIQILLRGSDMNENYNTANDIMKVIKNVPGLDDIKLSVDKSKPEIHVELDRDKMSMLGLSVSDVGTTMSLAFAGNTDLQYSENDQDYNINIKMDQFDRKKVDDIGSITFLSSTGQIIKLAQFANIYQSLGPNKLERYNRISSIMVNAEVVGRPVGTVGSEVQELIKNNIHPKNVSIEYKGQMERQAEAFGSLFAALFAAILLVYFVMVLLYNSYIYPFVVLFSLPVALIGAFLALALSGNNLSIYSIIGIIMLMGLAAKNAILIVDFTNKLKEEGLTLLEAIVEAGKERLRPILMTTIAMVFGMIPLAISSGAGAENRNGLAWVIIGGLTSSLMLTLLLVPSVYLTVEKYKNKLATRKAAKKAQKAAIEA